MLADPIVEELILAAPTRELAMEMCALDCAIEMGMTLAGYTFGTIRICPPLRVKKRFRALRDVVACEGSELNA